MKLAFTTTGMDFQSLIDPRFGRTDYILIYDSESENIEVLDNSEIAQEAHGAGPKTAQKISGLGIDALITGNGPGGNAYTVLEKTGIKIYIGAGDMSVADAYAAFKENKLSEM